VDDPHNLLTGCERITSLTAAKMPDWLSATVACDINLLCDSGKMVFDSENSYTRIHYL